MSICAFANCGLELPTGTAFTLCERCRVIDNRNRMALVTDPHSPLPSAYRGIIQGVVTQMTGEEMIRYVTAQESVYLEFCKLRKLYAPEGTKRIKLSLVEEIEDARAASDAMSIRATQSEKRDKKKKTVLDRQQKLLGCSEAEAKRIFNDDFGDL